ncbi:hypothetical protein CRYUN_Cryun08bG0096600 [Craigia yunnanensis]
MVSNAFITMYAKCGSIEDSCQMFNGMNGRDSVSWTAMVSAYIHGLGKTALMLFEELKREGFALDEITILAPLQAFSYTGLWEDVLCLFNEMESNYGIRPVIEHFACMVELLGRAGPLPKAMNFLNNSLFPVSPLRWRSLVNVKLQRDMDFGMLASRNLLDLSPEQAGSYVLVSNMCAGSGMLDEIGKVRTAMNDLKLSKVAGPLPKAMNFLNSLFPDSPLLWRLLVNVKLQRDLDFGMLASRNLLDLSPEEAGSYVLVSNMCAGSGMLDEIGKVRTAMNDLKLSQVAGCNWIEIDNKVHCFAESGKDHPESREIYAKLDN